MIKYKIVGSIVIYHADEAKLKKVITSFFHSQIKETKLCLVDNSAKTLPYIKKLLKKFPEIDYIFNNKNLGYGVAHNIAIEKYAHSTKYHVVLNPDIFFEEHVLGALYTRLEKDKSIGLASTKILFSNGNIQFAHKKYHLHLMSEYDSLSEKYLFLNQYSNACFKKQLINMN